MDDEHLRLLRIGYFIMSGMAALGMLAGFVYVFMGIFMGRAMEGQMQQPGPSPAPHLPAAMFTWFFAVFGGLIVVASCCYAVLCFVTARNLGRRRSRTLCFVTAGLSCLSMPLGTALGVCTFIVLSRPSVTALFEGAGAPSGPPPLPPYDATAG